MKRLFLDLETCPNIGYFWSAGYRVNISYQQIRDERRIITAAYKWAGKKIKTLTWDRNRQDQTLVEKLVPIMNEADEIVAHYGNGFDIPWVRTRALFHGIVCPIWKSVDTHAWAAKYFYLNSNKLDYIAKFLGIGTKIRTDYDLWVDATGGSDRVSKIAVEKMRVYNMHDTELLEPVFDKLSLYCPPHTHAGVLAGNEKWTCPRCGGSDVKIGGHRMVSRAGTVKQQMYCKSCPHYYQINAATLKLYKQRKEQ